MKCVVVDDEPYALSLIEGYILKTPFLQLEGSFTNPLKALGFLQKEKIDLVFLDINMPELSGLQLINSLNTPPQVIFTTAYPEFGAESYEYNAIDYLLKPVTYDRFLKAVGKTTIHESDLGNSSDHESVFIKSGTQIHQIPITSIKYIEAAGNYMTFFCKEKKLMTLLSMKEVKELLPQKNFIRIHKSYIISLHHIDIVERHRVIIEDQPIPIGVTYREEFLKRFENQQ